MKSSSSHRCASNSYRVGLSAASFSSARRAASASLQPPPPCSAITKPACFRQKTRNSCASPVPKNVDAIVIDSLPALKDPEDQQTLCAWIRENPELHFVILSRGVLPGWLMPFRFTGLLQLIEARDLLFDRDTVRVFLEKNGCTPTEAEINVIIHDSLGYPLALTALSRLMQNGQPYTPEIVGIVQRKSITILRITSSTAFQCRCAVCCSTSPRSIHSTPSLPR